MSGILSCESWAAVKNNNVKLFMFFKRKTSCTKNWITFQYQFNFHVQRFENNLMFIYWKLISLTS